MKTLSTIFVAGTALVVATLSSTASHAIGIVNCTGENIRVNFYNGKDIVRVAPLGGGLVKNGVYKRINAGQYDMRAKIFSTGVIDKYKKDFTGLNGSGDYVITRRGSQWEIQGGKGTSNCMHYEAFWDQPDGSADWMTGKYSGPKLERGDYHLVTLQSNNRTLKITPYKKGKAQQPSHFRRIGRVTFEHVGKTGGIYRFTNIGKLQWQSGDARNLTVNLARQ